MLGHICRSISSYTHKHAGKRRAAIMNKTSADATRLTAPPALHWARDRRALHPRRHGPTRTFEGFFFLVVMNEITATPVVNESKLSDSAQTQTKHTGSDPARARWCAPSPWQRWQQGTPAQRRQVASAQIGCTCRTSVAPHCQRSVHMQSGVERDACDHAFADRFRMCTTDDTRLPWSNSAYICALQ